MHLVILLYALFASLFLFSKMGLAHSSPFFFIGTRMLFAGLVLLAYHLIRYRRLNIQVQHLPWFFLLAAVNIFLTNAAEIWAIQGSVSSKMCLLYSLSPFLSALIAYWLLKEVMTKRKWLGMFIGFLGLAPITFLRSSDELLAGQFWLFSHVEWVGLLAVVSSVLGWIFLKKLMQASYSPVIANGFSMTLGGLMMLILSYQSQEPWNPVPVTDWISFLQITLAMCLISNLICYNLYGYLLKRYSATLMAFAGLVTPIFASLYGWLFLNEGLSWYVAAALAFFGLGLFLFHSDEAKRTQDLSGHLA